jgi:hypothetical protein
VIPRYGEESEMSQRRKDERAKGGRPIGGHEICGGNTADGANLGQEGKR